jgi:HD-GYP domain-containing protein (c-di-GMP phosphodiesterase class II)
VLHDLERELDPTSEHSRWLQSQGWRASLTLPLFHHNRLLGFLSLDSTRAGAFEPRALAALEPHLELLRLRISHHCRGIDSLEGSLELLLEIAELRDQETATHMERVSREERLVMQSHVAIGLALIETLITVMGLEADPDIDLLRQVVAHHHECLDGSGYPAGLCGEAVRRGCELGGKDRGGGRHR